MYDCMYDPTRKIVVFYTGDGSYQFIKSFDAFIKICCIEQLDVATKNQVEIIHISRDDLTPLPGG